MVGYGLAHIKAGVGLEVVEDARRQIRVGLNLFQAKRPRQARTATFAGQAPDMLVVVQRPVAHQLQ
ncbi:hypothetical protein D3C85_1549020 [compost metagenome]